MIENKLHFFFKNQIWHIGGLILLFYVSCQMVDFENDSNVFLGISSKNWFLFSMMTPLIHQGYVWLCWRSELCWKTISRTIGFKGYVVIFFIIAILRLLSVGLCFADYGTWYTPGWIAWSLSILIFIPFIYTIYSIKKYSYFETFKYRFKKSHIILKVCRDGRFDPSDLEALLTWRQTTARRHAERLRKPARYRCAVCTVRNPPCPPYAPPTDRSKAGTHRADRCKQLQTAEGSCS